MPNKLRWKGDSEDDWFPPDGHPDNVITKLLESRIIFLSGELNEGKAKDHIAKLITLDYQNPLKDIICYIDSYGGDVYSLIAIHDAMKMLRCDVATVCVGKAMSASAIVLLAGTCGKRFSTPNSRVMLHEITTGDEGRLSYMKDTVTEAQKLQDMIETFVRRYTKMTPKQIKAAFSKDYYIDAKLAKKLGVVDFIVDHPDDLHKRVKSE